MERLSRSIEKRRCPRSTVSLPIEYRRADEAHPRGGLIENISEMGLRVLSAQSIAIGAELNIAVLFVDGYELTQFTVLARVVWKNLRFGEDWSGYAYGVDFVHISRNDQRKLQQLLENHRSMEGSFEAAYPEHGPEIDFPGPLEVLQ